MSSLFFRKPISVYMSIPKTLALASTKGQSKKSPLYVAITVGLASLMCSKNRSITALSSGSLKIINGPAYSGFGVYSKSLMSSEIISRFVIKNPWPSIIYEIIIIWSITESGNFNGNFVVSISKARTTGSAL